MKLPGVISCHSCCQPYTPGCCAITIVLGQRSLTLSCTQRTTTLDLVKHLQAGDLDCMVWIARTSNLIILHDCQDARGFVHDRATWCCRSFAQLVVHELVRQYPEDSNLPPDSTYFAGLHAFLATNTDFQRLASAAGGPFDAVSVHHFCSPQGVFSQVPSSELPICGLPASG